MLKYRIEYALNPAIVVLHTTRLLGLPKYGEFLQAVELIAGVERVSPRNCDIEVIKNPLFEWARILPQVVSALRMHVAKDRPQLQLTPIQGA